MVAHKRQVTQIPAYLTDAQIAVLKAAAESAGLSMSAFVREAVRKAVEREGEQWPQEKIKHGDGKRFVKTP